MKHATKIKYEANIFRIENLGDLTADYFLYEIFGLNESSDDDNDFEVNIEHIIKSLSYKLKHPVTVLNRDGKPHLVIKADQAIVDKLPSEYRVKRGEVVYFKKIDHPFRLDFMNYDDATKNIIVRFLQFDIQSELNKHTGLWQPGSGDAFFNIIAKEKKDNIGVHTGFYARIIELPTGGFGVSVDITKKYISLCPLKFNITRDEFKKQHINKSHLVYQYGEKRYEIRPVELSDLTVSKYKFPRPDGTIVTLLQDIQEQFGRAMPPEVANLSDDASVLLYKTNDGQERAAVAALCYRVYDTEDPVVQKLHHKSIIDPFPRRRLIRIVQNNYFKNIMYGNVKLKVNLSPIELEKKKFTAPDILFGNDVILSVRNTPGAIITSIEELGRKRKSLLLDTKAGFFTTAEFQTQYYVVPQTIYNMYGNETHFLADLSAQVNKMHRTQRGWKPEVILYDDRNKRNSAAVGFEIVQKMEEKIKENSGGYALIMLPPGIEKLKRQHDDLAALVVSECLKNLSITASIMHSDTLKECYFYSDDYNKPGYHLRGDRKGKYSGYVRGVAINQVLLNNERWPYVLSTPLHADLTIGIDVKRNIAGFTFIDKHSKNILTTLDKSTNKERLSEGQVIKMLVRYITIQRNFLNGDINKIVVHRDGRLFRVERNGILKAVELLKAKGVLPVDVSVDMIEIPKHSIIQLRLFEVLREYDVLHTEFDLGNSPKGNNSVWNPEIGSWTRIGKREAFLCTTGREFGHDGSCNPLYVKHVSGNMPIENLLEDIYYLSCLAYTKPDDCSRYPLTIKITDKRINILGSDYESDALEIIRAVHA